MRDTQPPDVLPTAVPSLSCNSVFIEISNPTTEQLKGLVEAVCRCDRSGEEGILKSLRFNVIGDLDEDIDRIINEHYETVRLSQHQEVSFHVDVNVQHKRKADEDLLQTI